MMKFKKFLAAVMTGAMMFGVVATAAPAVSVYAAATNPTVLIDYENFTATLTSQTTDEKYLCLEVLKDEKGTKVSATYYYPLDTNLKAIVDLSFLKATKTQYIRVSDVSDTKKENSTIVTVNPQPAKLKVKYNASKTTLDEILSLTEGKNKVALADYGNYEYRGLYASKWSSAATTPTDQTLKDIDKKLDTLRIAGTTLIIRKKAVTTASVNGKDDAPAGAEVKVKIAAAAKAPKTTVDYAQGLISLPKGAEFRIAGSGDDVKWVSVGDKAVKWSSTTVLEKLGKENTDLTDAQRDGFQAEVRTAKTEKKAASNITFLNVPAAPKISVTGVTAPALPDATGDTATITCVEKEGSSTSIDGKVTITKEYDMSKGVSYRFEVEATNFDISTDEGKSWTTVKAGKDYVVYGEAKAQKLQIRRSAVKAKEKGADGAMPSNALEFDVLAKAATPKATADSGTTTVKVGEAEGITLARITEETDKGKVKITKSTAEGAVTIEYLDGETWKPISANITVGSATEDYTITIRAAKKAASGEVAATIESDPITVTIAVPTT